MHLQITCRMHHLGGNRKPLNYSKVLSRVDMVGGIWVE